VSSGPFATVFFAVVFAVCPTLFLFLDTEHLREIIFMLVIAMTVNGAWYALIGLGLWLPLVST
jgi:hypothetical protein